MIQPDRNVVEKVEGAGEELGTSPEDATRLQAEKKAAAALTEAETGNPLTPLTPREAMRLQDAQIRTKFEVERAANLEGVAKEKGQFEANVLKEALAPLEGTLDQQILEAEKRQAVATKALKEFNALRATRDQYVRDGDFDASDDEEEKLHTVESAIVNRFASSPANFAKMNDISKINVEGLSRHVLEFIKSNADYAAVGLRIQKGDLKHEDVARRLKEIPNEQKTLNGQRRSGEITIDEFKKRYNDLDDEMASFGCYMDIALFGDSIPSNFNMSDISKT